MEGMANLDRILPTVAPALRQIMWRVKEDRRATFEALPPAAGRVVFLGDSITEGGMWEEWFPELRTANRGVGGDAVRDVLGRLHSAIHEPAAVSLMVGTNDLHGLGRSSNVAGVATQTRELVGLIRQKAPSAPLLINSVLPRSPHFAERIRALNDRYRSVADQAHATYVDLWPTMAESDGSLRRAFTRDGIHLTAAGYQAWVDVLRPALDGSIGSAGRR